MKSADILTWLNGRLSGKVVVIHGGKEHTLWTQDEAQGDGLTIEDAVDRFVTAHGINVKKEIEGSLPRKMQ